jgi:hypothetical protein
MSRSGLRVFAIAVVVFLCLPASMFAATVAVGPSSCQPALHHFSTIQTAVTSVSPGDTVLLCPGSYPEQVKITQSLTLRGVTVGNSGQAVIVPPSGGLATNAVDEFGTTLALQLWVDNASGGPVNISDIVVDGTSNGVTTCHRVITGIFYENSGGTVDHVALRNQIGNVANTCGEAFLAEGGGASPTVTIQNSTIHNTDNGIYTQNQVTVIAKNNDVDVRGSATGIAITLDAGSNNTVSGNVVLTSNWGISSKVGSTGSVSSNTVAGGVYGIVTSADGVAVTSNKVFDGSSAGIYLVKPVAPIKGNNIANSNVGIEFNCVANPNVTRNTINEAQTGIDHVPTGLAVPTIYFNVLSQKAGC